MNNNHFENFISILPYNDGEIIDFIQTHAEKYNDCKGLLEVHSTEELKDSIYQESRINLFYGLYNKWMETVPDCHKKEVQQYHYSFTEDNSLDQFFLIILSLKSSKYVTYDKWDLVGKWYHHKSMSKYREPFPYYKDATQHNRLMVSTWLHCLQDVLYSEIHKIVKISSEENLCAFTPYATEERLQDIIKKNKLYDDLDESIIYFTNYMGYSTTKIAFLNVMDSLIKSDFHILRKNEWFHDFMTQLLEGLKHILCKLSVIPIPWLIDEIFNSICYPLLIGLDLCNNSFTNIALKLANCFNIWIEYAQSMSDIFSSDAYMNLISCLWIDYLLYCSESYPRFSAQTNDLTSRISLPMLRKHVNSISAKPDELRSYFYDIWRIANERELPLRKLNLQIANDIYNTISEIAVLRSNVHPYSSRMEPSTQAEFDKVFSNSRTFVSSYLNEGGYESKTSLLCYMMRHIYSDIKDISPATELDKSLIELILDELRRLHPYCVEDRDQAEFDEIWRSKLELKETSAKDEYWIFARIYKMCFETLCPSFSGKKL